MTVVGNSTTKEVGIPEAPKEVKAADADKTSKTNETQEAKKDGVFDDLQASTPAPVGESAADVEEASKIPQQVKDVFGGNVKINNEEYSQDELDITPAEKAAFIEAMITGNRYTQTFSLFGGRLSVTIRSRTADETHALYAFIRHTLASNTSDGLGMVEGDMAYVPLVAQIAEMNGTAFPEMKAPLMYTESEGKEIEPGWYGDFKAWKAKPEGLTSALISCVQLFEYKYWTMTKEASDKNFWNSDTSTEG